jgi:hypothetical protein
VTKKKGEDSYYDYYQVDTNKKSKKKFFGL